MQIFQYKKSFKGAIECVQCSYEKGISGEGSRLLA
jgi:hypothetical protein